MKSMNFKYFFVILTVLLAFERLEAQNFSIEADTLVFNKASNIFSAKGNVTIYIDGVTIKTQELTLTKL